MMIFEKAGRSNVSAFVPILNFYVLLRIAGMKKIWTIFYIMTLLNGYLILKSLMPLLMPDEVVHDRLNMLVFLHPHSFNTLFFTYWIFNTAHLLIYIRLHLRLAARFGKSALFGWGLALLEPVFYPILAFGKSEMKKETSSSEGMQ